MEDDDYVGSDEEFYTSDQEDDYSNEGPENEDYDTPCIPPKGTTTKVVHLLPQFILFDHSKKNLILFEFGVKLLLGCKYCFAYTG